ncbi:MAG: helix-turn-helix transcriptional regulator [Proteobacteria bacterium]|nr:helix-turn-helix transcriptional regulator [Pseudomonadota bacterium]HQR02800.1 helix-turn-helix transcriptional regulator [Rhodocyclaceae bacterium]
MKCTVPDYDALVDSIYRGATQEQPWLQVVERLARILEADDATLYMYSLRDQYCNYFVSTSKMPSLRDRGYVNRIIQEGRRYGADPARHPLTWRNARYRDLREADIYKRYIAPAGIEHMMVQDIYDDGETQIRIALSRFGTRSDFNGEECALLERVSHHVLRSLEFRTALEEKSAYSDQLAELLSRMSIGTLVVDSDKQVLSFNPAASRACARGLGVAMAQGRLSFGSGVEATRLAQGLDMVLSARRRGIIWQDTVSGMLSAAPGMPALEVVIKPLSLMNTSTAPTRPAALILLNDTRGNGDAVEVKTLCRVYHLTERQATLVALLGQGHTFNEVASILGISVNTVKKHAKSTYEKLGVNRRSQVVAMFSRCSANFA